MNKELHIERDYKLLVTMSTLEEILESKRTICKKIAEEAGAVVKIGRRRLYNLEKIKIYIDSISVGG